MDLVKLVVRAASQRHIYAIRRGLLINLPVAVIGSFAIMLNNLPLPWYQQAMFTTFGPAWPVFGQAVVGATINVMAILIVLSTSYFLAENHKLVKSGLVNPLTVPLVSLASLVTLVQPFAAEGVAGLPFELTGVGGIFFAIVTALTASEIYLWLAGWRQFSIRYFSDAADPVISQALSAMLPVMLTLAVFALVKTGAAVANITDLHQFVQQATARVFANIDSPLGAAVAFIVLVHLLWFCGMHGNHILGHVLPGINLQSVQAAAVFTGAGDSTGTLTKTFIDSFVLIGGSGSTVGLMLALLLVARRGNTARLAQLSIIPSLFNINELLIFGLPIVMSPIYFIPFLFVPLALTLVAYLAINTGMVAPVQQITSWTTPPIVGGYLATGSLSGLVLQLFNIALATCIYLPFVTINEKQKTAEIKQAFSQFMQELGSAGGQERKIFLTRTDSVGNLARVLAHDLKDALTGEKLFLEYQPQVNRQKRVVGIEALLRWAHESYGRISPLIIVAVAEEAGLIQDLGRFVFTQACRQMRHWKDVGIQDVRMAVNVSVTQLMHPLFTADILATIQASGLNPGDLIIEITETVALTNDYRTSGALARLRQSGLHIAIDDFGMGHTSLRYLKDFPVDTLKIDRVLSRDVVSDRSCQEIISSILSLCSSLEMQIIVEYVETEEQRNKLDQLGCEHYQGYLYSPPLPPAQALAYIIKQNQPAPTA